MEWNEIRDRIIKAFRQRVPRAKLPDPEQLRVEPGRGVRLCLTTQAVKKNMQEDSAAFEGWALLIHAYCKFHVELDLDLEHAPSEQPARGHYQRFLYRALKFSQQYSSWFSLSERLAPRVEQFRQYLYHGGSPAHPNPTFCNGLPSKPAKDGTSLESCVEGLFAGECRSVLTELTFQQAGISLIPDCVHRQLPVGLYETEKSEQNSVFTYGKSAVDLWALTTDGVVIYELKTRNPMVGLLTELMFYANCMYDLYVSQNRMRPFPPDGQTGQISADDRILRGYDQLYKKYCADKIATIHAAMLTDKLHPLIAPVTQELLDLMNTGSPYIRYYDLRYTLGQDGRPDIPESV